MSWFSDDLAEVIKRSEAAGVKSMIITGGSLHESGEALKLAKQLSEFIRSYYTRMND
jgi:Tat protein secretion system quality control protein TatD with DNase activity